MRWSKQVFVILILLVSVSSYNSYAQNITDTKDSKYVLAKTFFKALKSNNFKSLYPFIVSAKKIKEPLWWKPNTISGKEANKIRQNLINQLEAQFDKTRKNAIVKGVEWKHTNFLTCEYDNQRLYNLQFFFKHKKDEHRIEIEAFNYEGEEKLYLRENIHSAFEHIDDPVIGIDPRENSAKIQQLLSPILYKKPIANIDSLYEELAENIDAEKLEELSSLIDVNTHLMDSLIVLLDKAPLAGSQRMFTRYLMIERGNATAIKGNFEALNVFVKEEFTDSCLSNHKFNLIDTDKEDWEIYIFDDLPPSSAKKLFLKWKKDLKYFESRVMSMWREESRS